MSAIELYRWLQKKNVADATTKDDEFNHSPQLKQTLSKWFRVVLAVVMAVGMFVIPIQTVNATPNILFTDSGQQLGNSYSHGVSLGDVDGDGDMDAFVANDYSGQPNKVWLNDGSGNFSDSGQQLGNSQSYGVSLGDVDSDGDMDAFVANYGMPNEVWLNDGSGNFSDSGQQMVNSYSYGYGVSLGDVDSDGDMDAFVANSGAKKVWLNDGSGNFSDSGQQLGNSDSYGVSLGDVDSDGDMDAFVTNYTGQPNEVWLNDGSGKFSDSGQQLGNSSSLGVSLGDVDSDGDMDAFVANYGMPNEVWLNNLNPNIINIDAKKNNKDNPVIKSLAAGTYKIHVIGTTQGGKFDAYDTDDSSPPSGCDANGVNCTTGWETRYYYRSPKYHKIVDSSCTKEANPSDSCHYSTAAKAVAHPPSDSEFTLASQTDVKFYIYDSTLNNNEGGLSLEIIKQ